VLINNVGGAINFKPFTEFTGEQIQAEITRSLMTTLWSCRAALPGMVRRGTGVIVNVSSAATRGIHRIPYSAAKGAVNAATASLALEYAEHGIRVVGTAPGGTEAPPRRISRGTPTPETAQQRDWFQAHIDQTLDSSLMKRYGTLDEQAAAITFLASDEASYITGTVLPVAGGDLG
jgi:benzoate/toluate 1,2-dioxygenase reductase subunit